MAWRIRRVRQSGEKPPQTAPLRRTEAHASPLGDALDWRLLDSDGGTFEIRNLHRAVGGLVSHRCELMIRGNQHRLDPQ